MPDGVRARGALLDRFASLPPFARGAVWVVLMAAAVLWQYGPTLSYGFVYDDYLFLRPYDRVRAVSDSSSVADSSSQWLDEPASSPTAANTRAFLTGWAVAELYRPPMQPLAVAFYAARFDRWRFDARPYRACSLALFVAAGALGTWLTRRISQSAVAAGWFAAFWIVYPGLTISLSSAVTSQIALLQTVLWLTAFAWWAEVKRLTVICWLPLLVLAWAAWLFNDDAIRLLSALLVTHGMYAVLERRAGAGAGAGSGVGAARPVEAAPDTVADTAPDAVSDTATPQTSDPRAPRTTPAGGQLFALSFLLMVGVLLLALGAGWSRGIGAPMHPLLAPTGVLLALAAVIAAIDWVARHTYRRLRPALFIAALLALIAMQQVSRERIARAAPLGDDTRHSDAIVAQWTAVPEEIRTWLPVKALPPNGGDLARDLPCVSFGLYAPEKDFEHRLYRWTTAQAQLFVRASAPFIRFSVKAPSREQTPQPLTLRILVEGRLLAEQTLSAGAEASFVVPLPAPHPGSARMRRVDLQLDRAWMSGGDTRPRGVKLYDLSCRTERS